LKTNWVDAGRKEKKNAGFCNCKRKVPAVRAKKTGKPVGGVGRFHPKNINKGNFGEKKTRWMIDSWLLGERRREKSETVLDQKQIRKSFA